MGLRNTIKKKIDDRFSQRYEVKQINGEPFFVTGKNVPFRICTMSPNLLVVEYADTWEDGDCFNIDEMTEEEIFNAMLKEIEE